MSAPVDLPPESLAPAPEAGGPTVPESGGGGNPLSALSSAATPQDAIAAIDALEHSDVLAMVHALTNIVLPALAQKLKSAPPPGEAPTAEAPMPDAAPLPPAGGPEMGMGEARDAVINRIMGSA